MGPAHSDQHTDYQICTKTVMDTIADPDITFDAEGVCNYYYQYHERAGQFAMGGEEGQKALERIFEQIKAEGKGKEYDCITGVSGGVDSSYVIYLCHKYGLRPLIVHLDNGWNSEIANQNINNIIDRTGYDLHTYVIDWDEFRDLQRSFLKASVVDLELTSDHAIFATIYRLAHKYKLKYLINGFNISTEGILPSAWRWNKNDWLNIKSIQQQFGTLPLKTFPHLSFARKVYYERVMKHQVVMPLNFIDYNKDEAKETIQRELGWKDYGGKHFESIITRFYQGYILPEKFHIDKRKAHLSTLICSGQKTRDEALQELKSPIYDPEQMAEDREYVLKKLGLSDEAFEDIMRAPRKEHDDYPSYLTHHYRKHEQIMQTLSPLTKAAKRILGVKTTSKRY